VVTPSDDGESSTTREPPVSLGREVTVRDGGMIVELRLESDADEPTGARVRQQLPEGLDVADTGFRPDAAPQNWEVDDRELVAATTVPAEGTTLVFGLSVASDWSGADELPPPELAVASGEGPMAGARLDTDGADPETLEEAVRRVEAGEAPEHDLREGLPEPDPDDASGETVELTREALAKRNEELMWLRAEAVVAERERQQLRAAVRQLREVLVEAGAVDPGQFPSLDEVSTGGDDEGAREHDAD
jgi:hypothetical protein